MNRGMLLSDLEIEEGHRPLLYDDKTGCPLKPGIIIEGNPTIAIGWNVASRPCPRDLARFILGYFLDETWSALCADHPWVENLPEPCQRAMCDLAYNLGEGGLDDFRTFLSLMEQGRYGDAADDLQTTLWYKQVGTRGPRIAAIIRQGKT